MASHPLDVVGIGNAIVDVLVPVENRFLEERGMTKGAMTLIDDRRAVELYRSMESAIECSGGSAANSMVGLASLGGRGAYIGKVRDDPLGEVFARGIRSAGLEFGTSPADSGPSTGRCLIFVTPDAQRTLQTYLGASAMLGPGDIDPDTVRRARYTYLEGYLWDPPPAKEAFVRAAEIAHEAGGKIALTLSDSFCVERHRESFLELLSSHVDVLFANEDETVSLFRSESFEDAVARLEGRCEIAALTRGARGSVVVAGGETYEVAAAPVEQVVDTTGAGDLYAGGFLFGLSRGYGPAECARIGGLAAAEAISHIGARPQIPLAQLLDR